MKIIDASRLDALAKALADAGYRVVVPAEDGDLVRYTEWSPEVTIRTDAFPVNSVKDFLFPRSEVIDRYQLDGDDFAAKEVTPEAPKTVLLAVRPCDGQALALLDTIFNWDFEDDLYNARREATTVVPMVCTQADEQCFCTSVGGAPDSRQGADAMLRPADGGTKLILDPLTEKGEALVEAAGDALAEGEAEADPPADVPVRFDPETVRAWLEENFESDLGPDEPGVPGLRRLRVRLPHVPLLRHPGRKEPHRGGAPQKLGFVRVPAVHAARGRAQPPAGPGRPLAEPRHAQVRLHSRTVLASGLHGLRPVRPDLPGARGHARCLRANRRGKQKGPRP